MLFRARPKTMEMMSEWRDRMAAVEGDAQIVLVDTPGIFAPRRRLDRAMVQAAWGGAQGADLIALIVDGKAGLGPKMEPIIEALTHRPERKWLILNKVDIAIKEKLLVHTQKLYERIGFEETFFISAQTGDGLAELKSAFAGAMPQGPWHFPEDQVSDATDRMLAKGTRLNSLTLKTGPRQPMQASDTIE